MRRATRLFNRYRPVVYGAVAALAFILVAVWVASAEPHRPKSTVEQLADEMRAAGITGERLERVEAEVEQFRELIGTLPVDYRPSTTTFPPDEELPKPGPENFRSYGTLSADKCEILPQMPKDLTIVSCWAGDDIEGARRTVYVGFRDGLEAAQVYGHIFGLHDRGFVIEVPAVVQADSALIADFIDGEIVLTRDGKSDVRVPAQRLVGAG